MIEDDHVEFVRPPTVVVALSIDFDSNLIGL